MSFFKNLFAPMTSEKLESKGQNLYILSKIFMFIGLCGIVLALLIGVIAIALDGEFISPFIFDIHDDFAFAYFFVAIDYLAVLLGNRLNPPNLTISTIHQQPHFQQQ